MRLLRFAFLVVVVVVAMLSVSDASENKIGSIEFKCPSDIFTINWKINAAGVIVGTEPELKVSDARRVKLYGVCAGLLAEQKFNAKGNSLKAEKLEYNTCSMARISIVNKSGGEYLFSPLGYKTSGPITDVTQRSIHYCKSCK